MIYFFFHPDRLEEEKRKLKEKDRPKGASGTASRIPRAALTNVRVVQPNLVYAVGIIMDICNEDTLKGSEFFGQFGKTVKVSVNRSNQYASAMARHGPTGSAYVTYKRAEDALRCIKSIDGALWRGKPVKACFGTTKYCNAFLKGVPCNNPECLYLHDLADDADCLTKEEVAAGLLPARFLAMGATNTFKPRLTINLIPNAQTAAAQAAAAAAAAAGQPPAAIAAAAAAAGGISRALPERTQQPLQSQQQPQQQALPPHHLSSSSSSTSAPRVLTVPSAAIPSSAGRIPSTSHGVMHHQDSINGNGGSYGSYGALQMSNISTSPGRVYPSGGSFSGGSIAGPPGMAPRGLWASAAAQTGIMPTAAPPPVAVPPPPPSENKQEWPTLAAPPSASTSGAGGGDNDDGSRGESSGRPPSMAEQLARAHSNVTDGKGTKQIKKLLPLASPGKLKPLLGKSLQRTTSPVDVHASASTSDETGMHHHHHQDYRHVLPNGRSSGSIARGTGPSVGAIGLGIIDLSLGGGGGGGPIGSSSSSGPPPGFTALNSSNDPLAAPKPAARGPPPGFGGPSPFTQQQQQQEQGTAPSKVAPPPGFGGLSAGSGMNATTLSPHSSMESGGGAPSSGYSPFIGGSALFEPSTLASNEQRQLPVGNTSIAGAGSGGAAAAAAAAAASRRQKSRFAFANAEEDMLNSMRSSYSAPHGTSHYNSTGSGTGGLPIQHRSSFEHAPSPPSVHSLNDPGQQQPSPQDASAFFKSLFPGANINVANASSSVSPQQAQQAPSPMQQRVSAPPGFGAMSHTAGAAPTQHAQHAYNPLSGMFPSASLSHSHSGGPTEPSQSTTSGGAGLAPGLALLRQLQSGGQAHPHTHGGDPSSGFAASPGPPPGYNGGASQPPPGFGMRM